MKRKRVLLLLVVVTLLVLAWQLPALLRAIPSRYVAAYFPQSLQSLAEREHVEVLPTAQGFSESGSSLQGALPAARVVTAEARSSLEIQEQDSGEPPAEEEAAATLLPSPTALFATPAPTATPVPIPAEARLSPIQHHFQTWNNCGPATLSMALSYFDINHSQVQTAAVLKPDPEDRNVTPEEMADYVNETDGLSAITRANGNLDTLRRLVASGYPVIVELGIDPPGEYRWMGWYGHYLLVVAYNNRAGSVWVYDSWFGTSEVPGENADDQGREMSFEQLDNYWQQFNRNYIVLFESEMVNDVTGIIGEEMNDDLMWQNALETTQAELAAEPDNKFIWFNLGTVQNELGDHQAAAAAFDQARSMGLPWRMLWYQFGPYEAYYEIGRYEDVILLTDTTLNQRPYFEESYYYKGLALAALGEDGEARKNLEMAVRFNPNFALASAALDGLQG